MKVAKFGLTGSLPDILWDGAVAKDHDVAATQICIHDNGDADFANIDYAGKLAKFSTDMKPHDCELPALQPVSWPGLDSRAVQLTRSRCRPHCFAFCALVALAASACHRAPRTGLDFAGEFPERLSEWHLLEQRDGKLAPNDGVTPYDLNSPLFSDYAHKLRTVVLPPGTSIRYGEDAFEFPVGTVITKTFYYPRADGGAKGSIAVRKVLAQAPRRVARSRPGAPARNAPADQHVVRLGRDSVRVECRADRSDARARRRHVVAGAGQRRRPSAVRVPRAGHESVRGLSCARASLAEDRADRHSRAPLEQDFRYGEASENQLAALAEGRPADRRARSCARAAQRALGRSCGRRARSRARGLTST